MPWNKRLADIEAKVAKIKEQLIAAEASNNGELQCEMMREYLKAQRQHKTVADQKALMDECMATLKKHLGVA